MKNKTTFPFLFSSKTSWKKQKSERCDSLSEKTKAIFLHKFLIAAKNDIAISKLNPSRQSVGSAE
jgi:hypothetical protein